MSSNAETRWLVRAECLQLLLLVRHFVNPPPFLQETRCSFRRLWTIYRDSSDSVFPIVLDLLVHHASTRLQSGSQPYFLICVPADGLICFSSSGTQVHTSFHRRGHKDFAVDLVTNFTTLTS